MKLVSGPNFHAVVWDELHGWRSIQQVLVDSGVDMAGWKLLSANDISADGNVVVGEGINPEGHIEAWLTDLSNPALLPGDYDGNDIVGQGDLDLVLLSWGDESVSTPDGWIRNLPDGRIDQSELDDVLLHWATTQNPESPSITVVPEPSAVLIVLSILVASSRMWLQTLTRGSTRQCLPTAWRAPIGCLVCLAGADADAAELVWIGGTDNS